MTDSGTDNTIILAGRVIGFTPPTTGQVEAMVRIARTLEKGADDSPVDFWMTQIDRIGRLIDALINEADREIVDDLYLTGKISSLEALEAIMKKINTNAEASENKAIGKANKVRVQRK